MPALMNRKDLHDGVTLLSQKTEKFMTNYVSVTFLNPLKNPDASLFALIPFVLKRGTKNYPDLMALNRKTDELYGASVNVSVQKKGDFQAVSLGLKFIRNSCTINGENLEQDCLDLLFEILFSPYLPGGAFDKDVVASEKENLKDLINSEINDKRTYALKRCADLMFENTPYGINSLGTVEDVDKINEKSLLDYYNKFLKSSQIIVFAEGDLDFARLEERLTAEFPARTAYEGLNTALKETKGGPRVIEEAMDVNQGKLTLGFTTGYLPTHREYPALLLLNCIYGGSPSSKLFENVRERLSLCYYCASKLESLKGAMFVYSGVEFDKKEEAYNEILKQLNMIKNGEISSDEIFAAKKTLAGTYSAVADSPVTTENFYIDLLLGGRMYSPEELSERVQSVQTAQVSEVAEKILLDTVYFLKGETKNA